MAMNADQVEERIRHELAAFRYESPEQTWGVPWSSDRVTAEVENLKSALIRPEVVAVDFPKAGTRLLWRVTRDLENGYFVAFDAESAEFGLVAHGARAEDAGVWGDLVGTFMAR